MSFLMDPKCIDWASIVRYHYSNVAVVGGFGVGFLSYAHRATGGLVLVCIMTAVGLAERLHLLCIVLRSITAFCCLRREDIAIFTRSRCLPDSCPPYLRGRG